MTGFSSQPFPAALRRLKEDRRLSYRQLAYLTGLSAGYLNHLSKGTRPMPPDEVLERIASALHVRPDYFMEYRFRHVVAALRRSPLLVSALYTIFSETATARRQLLGHPPDFEEEPLPLKREDADE